MHADLICTVFGATLIKQLLCCIPTAQCDKPPAIVNGFITYAPDDVARYDIGTVATYECNPGFILVGVVTRDCIGPGVDVNTAEFNSEAPVCIRKYTV